MGKQNLFKKLLRRATKNGWAVPPENTPFSDDAWIRYWQAMELYSVEPNAGRPIPPHRTGGGHVFS